jgi:hypothetical protein
MVKNTYWPHRANFERLQRSSLAWSLLCPGPMVDRAPVGLGTLRVSIDRLPVSISRASRLLPAPLLLPIFASKIPEMIIPYADAAALMLAHLGAEGEAGASPCWRGLARGDEGSQEHVGCHTDVAPD